MNRTLTILRYVALPLILANSSNADTNVTPIVKHLKGKYVIDVRTESEWKGGHVESAVLIPHDQIKVRITEVTKDKSAPIALYCRSGRRSAIALNTLKELGYTNLENLGSLQDAQKKLGVSP